MSLSVEGMCTQLIVNGQSKEVRFIVQDSDGIFYTCDYTFTDDFPLRKGDMVSAIGDWTQKLSDGEYINIFQCNSITARYEFDLFNFLMAYMPYQKLKEESDLENLTKFYRDCTNNIIQFCTKMMGKYDIDNLNEMFIYFYNCVRINDNDPLIDFGKNCFKNPDLKKIKSFFRLWNSQVLFRPLQLLGLSESEIKKINIPLDKAYIIAKTNPYRLPQIPIEKADKIAIHHLRLGFEPDGYNGITNHEELEYLSNEAHMCGEIIRMVYNNIEDRKWTSTPVARILEKYKLYHMLKETLEKYYYCIEDLESLYITEMYDMELMVARKINKLYSKPDVEIGELVFPGIIPTQNQQAAIKGALSKWISLIYGGPGTGKTTIMSEIIRNASLMGKKTLCLAFTGAATTRIRETTTESMVFDMTDIKTINMAITLANTIMDIKPNIIIIDEVSMDSTKLIAEFFSTFKRLNCQYILIGDEDQLEPIEWGNFMKCLINTPINKYELTDNFRSQETIIKICKNIVNHERILNHKNVEWNRIGDDYRIMEGDIPMLEQLIAYYAREFKYDNSLSVEQNHEAFGKYRDKFTIICPYVKVCNEINPIFQKYFMSHVKEKTIIGETTYYLGDRVMKLVNDYGINVMNGEQGKIIKVTSNYVVCMFRNKNETITPYVDRSKFAAMKAFVKYNKIKFTPYEVTKDGQKKEKPADQIKFEVQQLKDIYLSQFTKNPSVLGQSDGNHQESEQLKHQGVNQFHTYTNSSQNYKDAPKETIELYFELLEEYPQAMYNIQEEAEFLNINQICLAYALTTHKSQGSQYEYIIFFLNGKFNAFVTVNNVYTGLSRAKKHLDIVTTSITLLDAACLTKQRYVNDKLATRINSLMPPEEVAKLVPLLIDDIQDSSVAPILSIEECEDVDFDMDDFF